MTLGKKSLFRRGQSPSTQSRRVAAWLSLRPTSDSIREMAAKNPRSVDFVLLDHWKDMYLPDIKVILETNILAPNAVVVADNTLFPGTPEYLEFIRAHPDFTRRVLCVRACVHGGAVCLEGRAGSCSLLVSCLDWCHRPVLTGAMSGGCGCVPVVQRATHDPFGVLDHD